MEYKLYSKEELKSKLTKPQYGLLKDICEKNGLGKDQLFRVKNGKWISFNAQKALNDYFNGIYYTK